MKTKLFIAGMLLVATIPVRAATNDLVSALQRGLFEEEANHNLDAAAQAYQAVSARFDQDRKLAATAIFRLGEVYRKQGKTNEATAQYERIVREFSDQQTLVTLSRQNLGGLSTKKEPTISSPLTRAARLEQKGLLEEEIKLVELDLADLRKQLANGVVPQSEVRAKEREVLKLRQQVAALIVDDTEVGAGTSTTPVTDDEEKEIRRIQEMIKNSPDLINAPDAGGTLPLIAAASRGQLRVAQFLLDSGAGVNRAVANGITAPHAAAENGHKAMIELLTQHKADLEARENHGYTPLHLAASKGFQGVAETLVAAKADVNARSKTQTTPLHLTAAIGQGALTAFLIAKGADVEAKDNSGSTPLIIAASRGNEGLVTALLAAKADPNITDSSGRTALSFAADYGRADMVKALLEAKADPNAGTSTLPLAAGCNREDTNVVNLLLRAGADPNREARVTFDVKLNGMNFREWTPLLIATARSRADLVRLLFQFKANPGAGRPGWHSPLVWETYGNADVLKAFLDAGADHNADAGDGDGTRSLLYMAASVGNAAGVEALLAAGARVNPPGDARDTPLHIAVDKGDEKTIRLLLDAGAEVNRRNRDGFMPLWRAVLGRKTDIAGLLLAHGADPNPILDNGTTPLHFAVNQQDRPLVQLLLTNKADVNLRDRNGMTPLDFAKQKIARPVSPGTIPAVPLPPALSDQSRKVADTQPASPGTLADLLRQHGALDDLPDLSSIRVTRVGVAQPMVVFMRDTNSVNRFTLLEVVRNFYPEIRGIPTSLPFPDFSKIIIHRPVTGKSGAKKEITVNLLTVTNSFDCAKDTWLEFGDLVEIPEREHTLAEQAIGLTSQQNLELGRCLEGKVTFVVRGQKAEFKLTGLSNTGWLQSALDGVRNLLRSSSALSHIKITRTDPTTGKTNEFLTDSKSPGPNNVWLRDGDVIEVPDKP